MEFASAEPLAYAVAADLQAVAFEFVGGVAWRAGDLQFPQFPVSFGFDGRYWPFPAARAGCRQCVRRGLQLAVAVWAGAYEYHVFLRCEGLVVASGDALQCVVVVFDGGHVEDGVSVGEYSFPCFVPFQVGVGCVDFACGFGEPLAACVDEVECMLVEWEGRVTVAWRVGAFADACLFEAEAVQCWQLLVAEPVDELPVVFLAVTTDPVGWLDLRSAGGAFHYRGLLVQG